MVMLLLLSVGNVVDGVEDARLESEIEFVLDDYGS